MARFLPSISLSEQHMLRITGILSVWKWPWWNFILELV